MGATKREWIGAALGVGLGLSVLGAPGCGDETESSATTTPAAGGNGAGGATAGGGTPTGGAGGTSTTGGNGGSAAAGAYPNEGSPLGTNLTGISDWSHEWAFVDAMKASRDWISGSSSAWDDGRSIDVDEHGWVQSLDTDQIVRTLLFWDLTDGYPAGRYVVLYEGEGTMEYGGSATLDSGASSPGRDVLDVDPSNGGILINITAIDSGNPLRNVRVIMPGGACSDDRFAACDDATPCVSGSCQPFEDSYATQIFHPTFLDRIKTYRALRFMDWMATNGSLETAWSGRPQPDDVRWSTHGVPVEIMVELANRLHADPWFTLPHLADDGYVTAFATAVRDSLEPSLRVYVEHSNEVWNGIFAQAGYAAERGLALGLSTNSFEAQLRYHSRRSVQIFALFEAALGGTDRLVRAMGSQASNPWVSEQVLDFESAAAHTDALAIAPYFGGYLGGPDMQATVGAMSVDELLAELESTALPDALDWVEQSATVAADRSVELIAYEAGQHLAGNGGVENNDTINGLFDDANRHAGMGTLYADYLAGWQAGGGALLMHFVNCSGYSKWGRWGALEQLDQPRAEAPKFDALQTFIETTTPWW